MLGTVEKPRISPWLMITLMGGSAFIGYLFGSLMELRDRTR